MKSSKHYQSHQKLFATNTIAVVPMMSVTHININIFADDHCFHTDSTVMIVLT